VGLDSAAAASQPHGMGKALSCAGWTGALAAAACLACVHEVYRAEPASPPPEPVRDPAVRILVFGDFGRRTLPQRLVARALRRAAAARPFDLALQLGDNLYYCGPDPLRPPAESCRFEADGATVAAGVPPSDDPIFDENEAPLRGLRARDGAPLPMFLALGNHDIGWGGGRCDVSGIDYGEALRRRACLEVARSTPTWTMPGRHFVIDRGPVRIVVVDTNVVVADYGGFTLDAEVEFVRTATAGCGAERLCFLAGHHTPAAVHAYRVGRGPTPFRERMERLLAAAGGRARAFFAGHVHMLEHLSLGGLDVFVSGSTAMGGFMGLKHVVPARAIPRFATAAWGFAVLEANAARRWGVRFYDNWGNPLYCCVAGEGGACLPAACD
jgi:Calcineurin-like phosphoesterase